MRVLRQSVVCQVKYQPSPPIGIECMTLTMRHSGCLAFQLGRPVLHMNDSSIRDGLGE